VTLCDLERAAALLDDARRTGVWLDALPAALTPGSVEDAYRVQDAVTARCARVPAGWKIGATSRATQTLLGTPEPIVGRMFADAVFPTPAIVRGQRPDLLIVERHVSLGRDHRAAELHRQDHRQSRRQSVRHELHRSARR